MTKLSKQLALVIACIMVLSLLPVRTANALQASQANVFTGDGFTIEHTVTSWQGSIYNAEMRITNTGSANIYN